MGNSALASHYPKAVRKAGTGYGCKLQRVHMGSSSSILNSGLRISFPGTSRDLPRDPALELHEAGFKAE